MPGPALPELVERLARQRLETSPEPPPASHARPATARDEIERDLPVEQTPSHGARAAQTAIAPLVGARMDFQLDA